MHELQIAQNIITIINEELEKNNRTEKVRDVVFVAGRMRAIIPETLTFSFDVQKKEHRQLSDANLTIREVDIIIQCRDCGTQHSIDEPTFHCKKCLSTNIEIKSGNELYVDCVELFDGNEEKG